MTQNTYTVTTTDDVVTVQGASASYDRDALTIWADAEGNRLAAVFRHWEHVTVERPEPEERRADWRSVMAQTFGEGEPYSDLIDLDKRIAEVVNDSKATALLVERAARTGFAAGVEAGRKAGREAAR